MGKRTEDPIVYDYNCSLFDMIIKLQLVEHFFQSLVNTSGMTLHIRQVHNSPIPFYSSYFFYEAIAMEVSLDLSFSFQLHSVAYETLSAGMPLYNASPKLLMNVFQLFSASYL